MALLRGRQTTPAGSLFLNGLNLCSARAFFAPYAFSYLCVCRVCVCHLQLQEAKQLERERHRQHSPVTPHAEPESPQLHTHVHPPAKGPSREANGPVTPPTPPTPINNALPPTPSTPSTPGPEACSTPASEEPGEQEERGNHVEQEERGPVYESPDPENGSEFCPAENEQTEADQATAAAAAVAAAQGETC